MSEAIQEQPPKATRPRANYLVAAAAFVIVIAGIREASDLVLQFLVAGFLAVAVAPPIFYLQRKGAPFAVGLALVMGAFLGVIGSVATLVGSTVNEFRRELPVYNARIQDVLFDVLAWFKEYGIELTLDNTIADIVNPGQAMNLAATVFTGVGGVLANSFIILLMVIFLLMEAATLPAKLHTAFGDDSQALSRFEELGASVNRYLVIKTWISLATGVIAGVWCAILGVDFALLWGVLAFLLNYVPNIGSILAAVPPSLLALVQYGPGTAFLVAIGFIVLNNVLGNVVEPRYMGAGLGLSTFAVLMSLLFWGWVLGALGMLLSIPLTMAVKIAMEGSEETRWIAIMLGSGSAAEAIASRGEEAQVAEGA